METETLPVAPTAPAISRVNRYRSPLKGVIVTGKLADPSTAETSLTSNPVTASPKSTSNTICAALVGDGVMAVSRGNGASVSISMLGSPSETTSALPAASAPPVMLKAATPVDSGLPTVIWPE